MYKSYMTGLDADLDEDFDVDHEDFIDFLKCMNGPNVPPLPGCQ